MSRRTNYCQNNKKLLLNKNLKHEMAGEDKSKRKTWTLLETKGLLKCYLARREEFLHRRKKRNAYAHVLEDMQAQGFTNSSTTVIALENKMRTLLTAYKYTKDTDNRTGVSSFIAPYIEDMEEIFGDSVLAGNSHTLSVGLVRSPPLPVAIHCIDWSETHELEATTSSTIVSPVSARDATSPVPSSSSSTPPPQPAQPNRRRKTAKERYYENKIKIKEQELEEKKRFNNSVLQTIREMELEKLQILKRSLYK